MPGAGKGYFYEPTIISDVSEGAGTPHNMDYSPTRWPESPRTAVQRAPCAPNGPNPPRVVCVRPPGSLDRAVDMLEAALESPERAGDPTVHAANIDYPQE